MVFKGRVSMMSVPSVKAQAFRRSAKYVNVRIDCGDVPTESGDAIFPPALRSSF
jgi:regulator of RNase E activity RraA